VVYVFLQARRDGASAKRFFKKLFDKLRSYGFAHNAQTHSGSRATLFPSKRTSYYLTRGQLVDRDQHS
jgi:transposase-like protein